MQVAVAGVSVGRHEEAVARPRSRALARTISGMRERGTAMSSLSLSGWSSRSATESYLRVSQISRRCASSWATITSPDASALTSSATRAISAKTAFLVVAVGLDEHRGAGARTGTRTRWPSGARLQRDVVDQLEAARDDARRQHPRDGPRRVARRSRTPPGRWRRGAARGRSFSVISVTTPSVPSLPTSSAVRS